MRELRESTTKLNVRLSGKLRLLPLIDRALDLFFSHVLVGSAAHGVFDFTDLRFAAADVAAGQAAEGVAAAWGSGGMDVGEVLIGGLILGGKQ